MLIIPFATKMDWSKPPFVTLLLVLVNVLIFSFWQSGDPHRYEVALTQYIQSSLPKIEFPRYEAFLRQNDRADDADDIAAMRHHPSAYPDIVLSIQNDPAFQRALKDGDVVKATDPIYAQWHRDRQAFEKKFSTIVEENYTFVPAMPKLSSAFLQMFLHESVMHLVGNMVFLLIFGMVVERILGSGVYFVTYIVGGLTSLAFYVAFNRHSNIHLLGASGAIMAIAGVYSVLFGARKIPFFYSVIVYFGYIRAPAYVLLIAWLGIEGYDQWSDKVSHVAYLDHIGGLFGGAVMAYIAKYAEIIDPTGLEIKENTEGSRTWLGEYDRGLALLGSMESAKAADIFAKLHHKHPEESDILWHYYKSAKYQPQSEAYHLSALALLDKAEAGMFKPDRIAKVFEEYLKLASPKPKLKREELHRLALYFLKHRYLKEASKLTAILIRHDAGSERTANLAVGLARQLRLEKQLDDAAKLLRWVLHQHGDSSVAAQARTMLKINPQTGLES